MILIDNIWKRTIDNSNHSDDDDDDDNDNNNNISNKDINYNNDTYN